MVPKHIWATLGDQTKYEDKNPTGTGPYVFNSFTPQLIKLTKNPHFWQADKPIVPEIDFPAFNGNTTAEPAMNTGQTDWNGLITPDVNKTFLQRDSAHNPSSLPPSEPLILLV